MCFYVLWAYAWNKDGLDWIRYSCLPQLTYRSFRWKIGLHSESEWIFCRQYALELFVTVLMCVLQCKVPMGKRLAIVWLYRDDKYYNTSIITCIYAVSPKIDPNSNVNNNKFTERTGTRVSSALSLFPQQLRILRPNFWAAQTVPMPMLSGFRPRVFSLQILIPNLYRRRYAILVRLFLVYTVPMEGRYCLALLSVSFVVGLSVIVVKTRTPTCQFHQSLAASIKKY